MRVAALLVILAASCRPLAEARPVSLTASARSHCQGGRGRVDELLKYHPELADTPKDILHRVQVAIDAGVVPPIIHQSWKTHAVPEGFRRWAESWQAMHPDWLYVFWSDDENRQLVQDHFSATLEVYDAFEDNVARADSVRAMYMHRYGGIYSDLDSLPLQSLAPLVDGKRAFLAQMGDDKSFGHSIPNAFMASSVGDQFWLHLLRLMKHGLADAKGGPEVKTGPVLLKKAYDTFVSVQHKLVDAVKLLPPDVIYPINWNVDNFRDIESKLSECGSSYNEAECRRSLRTLFPEAFTVHWWSHSWG